MGSTVFKVINKGLKLLIESANSIIHNVDLTEEKSLKVSVQVVDPKDKSMLSKAKAKKVKVSKGDQDDEVTFSGKKADIRSLMNDLGFEDEDLKDTYPEVL